MLIYKSRNKGSALISALFIMTLVAIAATAMSIRLQLDIYRTRISIASDKLSLAAQLVSFWALSEMGNPKQTFTRSDNTGKVLDFPVQFQSMYPAIKIKGGLYDLQARFNLNNLSDKKYLSFFQEFLKNTAKNFDAKERDAIAPRLSNWIGLYRPGQDEMFNLSYYVKHKPPYYPAHQPLQNVSEFRLLMGVSAKLYQSLIKDIVALPDLTPININTASKNLLRSLGMGMNENQLEELMAARGKEGVSDLNKITPLLQKLNIRAEQITIESQYFMAVAYAKTEDLNLISYTILKRIKDKNGKLFLSILSESLNSIE